MKISESFHKVSRETFSLKKILSTLIKKPIEKLPGSIYFWIFVWACLFFTYSHFLNHDVNLQVANKIAYYSQIFFDISVGLTCIMAYKSAIDRTFKIFFGLFLLSVIIGLYSDEVYNFIFHFFTISTNNPNMNLLWIIPYSLFLTIQIFAWLYLMRSNEKVAYPIKETWFSKFCFIQAPVIVLISIFLSGAFKDTQFSIYGAIQILNTIEEIALFAIVSIVLSKSRSKWVSCLSSGILLLIMFNMAHRFSYSGGVFFKMFDVAWLICFVFIAFGFLYFTKNTKKVDFHDDKSMYVLSSSLLLLVTSILVVSFFVLEIFISNYIELNSTSYLKNILNNIPGILITLFTISVFTGKMISLCALRSIENISNRVKLMQGNQSDINNVKNQKYQISEIQNLDDFILSTMKKLHIANQAKSEFLMNMSHDFRTPASGIYSMSKLIYERVSDEKIKTLQKLVVDSSKQLMEVLDQILGYFKLFYDEKKLSSTVVHVNKLVSDVVLLMSAKSKEKGLTIYVDCHESPIFFIADQMILHCIFVNLFSNAIKFTDEGFVKIIVYEYRENNIKNLVIKIEDSGIGIDESNFDLIFEPFYRISSSCSSKYSGIGLGLSNVKLAVEKLGGRIKLHSALGWGAVFEIILPMVMG